MGFLSKLFRRKGGDGDRTKKKKGKKVSKDKHIIPDVDPANTSSVVGTSDEDGLLRRQGSFENTSLTGRGSSSSREKDIEAALAYPHNNEQIRILSPRNNLRSPNSISMSSPNSISMSSPSSMSSLSKPDKNKMWNDEPRLTIIGSHDENHDHNAPNALSPRLSYQELQQFNGVQQTRSLSPSHGLPASQPTTMFAMSSEIPNQQMHAMDDMDRSDASSASFNLSTDAEDSEYEGLRRRGVIPQPLNTSTLMDTSVMSGVSAPTTYTTDDDRIFPALQTDDDMTQATEPSTRSPPSQPQGLLVPLSTPDDEPGRINISPMNTDSYDDMRAWNISPSTQASNRTPASREPTSAKSQVSPAFSFQNSGSMFENNSKPKNSSNPSAAVRSFTSPTSQASSNEFSQNDDFANFADFSSFGNSNMEVVRWSDAGKSNKPSPSSSPRDDFERNFEAFDKKFDQTFDKKFDNEQSRVSSTVSASQPDSSLSDLLAQAKNKQRRNSRGTSRSGRPSSSSVNSAPAITASYLRQHHNLRSQNGSSYHEHEANRASHDATSVSDIIHSLEATNQSRMKPTSTAMSSHRSMGDTGAANMARTAKERLREKRRNEREHGAARGLQKTRSSEASSSENSGDEEPDSWLFDEVTGALGPRGIAADLESLSGRSNRSKNSTGNKSHRSHKSHRSRASRRRPKSSSNESVDSRGSRASRYSHRSTKSFLSQMSEQSRSVANDLLRLEMQLAMVGSQENRDDVPARAGGSVGGASIGGASRTSRTSRKSMTSHRTHPSSIARRNKVTVVAPPGKIGIILANKADTKGTVVSGVRTTSVLAEKVSPGDRIIAIDGEDVSRMTVSEITTIMARKSEFERTLTVLTTPQLSIGGLESIPNSSSPVESGRAIEPFDSSYQYRR
jgi:hypothetical protein